MQPYFAQMATATGTAWGPNATPPDVAASATLSGQTRPDRSPRRREPLHRRRRRTQAARKSSATNLTKFIKSIDAKLSNAAFVDKAPADVVQQQRDKRAELAAQLESVDAALKKLK